MRAIFVTFSLLLLGTPLFAQPIASLQRQAERKWEQGQFAEAAALYERAGRLLQHEPRWLYQAAEAYLTARDYINAANCYQAVMDKPEFPLAALRYARALKQQGRYAEARAAFQKTGETYNGPQKEVMVQVVANELRGCDLLLQPAEDSTQQAIVHWLEPALAQSGNSFAPLPFSDTLLYFSQAMPPQSVLMRTSRRDGAWRTPEAAQGLPEAAAAGFLCGSFSPDGQRFYYAKTTRPPLATQGGSTQPVEGALYALRRDPETNLWQEPVRLRDYINMEGSTNLWPFVCHIGEEEWLFFASNKAGGFGGMDLYCCKRPLLSDDMDFSFPLNLGASINTGSDETTPFYDIFTQTLWFSSQGHPSLGGLDVQRATGEGNRWSAPQNAGKPINSPADDSFFVLKRDGTGAFMASNRMVARQKTSTADDDLFEVIFPEEP
jgi:hypothetical protein